MLAEKFTGSLRGCAFIIFLYIIAQSSAWLTVWLTEVDHLTTLFFSIGIEKRNLSGDLCFLSLNVDALRKFGGILENWSFFNFNKAFCCCYCLCLCLSVCFSACVWNVKNNMKIYEIKRVKLPSFYSNRMLKMTSSRNS